MMDLGPPLQRRGQPVPVDHGLVVPVARYTGASSHVLFALLDRYRDACEAGNQTMARHCAVTLQRKLVDYALATKSLLPGRL